MIPRAALGYQSTTLRVALGVGVPAVVRVASVMQPEGERGDGGVLVLCAGAREIVYTLAGGIL
jgi:hypothetical protein